MVPALQSNTQATKVQVASSLGKELLDNVRVWSEGNWNNALSLPTGTSNTYYLDTALSPFQAATGTESLVTGVSSGLVGWWKFDEGTGTIAYDYSGNNATGTLLGTPTWVSGKVGPYAISVGNSSYSQNGYINLGETLPSSSFTLSLWLNPSGIGSQCSTNQCIVLGGENYNTNGFRAGYPNSSAFFSFWTNQSGGSISLASLSPSSAGNWDFIAVTYANGSASLYRNGILQGSATGTYILGPNMGIDTGVGGTSWFWGKVDDVRVYNRALSTAEINQIYNAPVYLRYFYLSDVYRDSAGNIVTSGGTYDPSTKQVTVGYNWLGSSATNTMTTYIVRGRNNVVVQNDWSVGPGVTSSVTSIDNRFASSTHIDYQTTTGAIYVAIPGY